MDFPFSTVAVEGEKTMSAANAGSMLPKIARLRIARRVKNEKLFLCVECFPNISQKGYYKYTYKYTRDNIRSA